MDMQAIRAATPLTATTVYMDTAAASIPPDVVLEEARRYLLDTGHIGIYLPSFRKETYARVEGVRAQLAAFLGAQPHEIAFTKNGTEAISLVARGIDWKAGDEILVADTEMLSNLLPWRRLEQTHQVVVKMIAADAEVRTRWITSAELEANPSLVKTMSVKPPMGSGRVRLVEIVGYDLQPCGGTHVRRTSEIGRIAVTQVEKKGKLNRRVRLAFV